MIVFASFLGALTLAAVHLLAGKLPFLGSAMRSRWLSFASGVSVAFVFVHILPMLQEAQRLIRQIDTPSLSYFQHHVYVISLVGLALFYGLERLTWSGDDTASRKEHDRISSHVFVIRIIFFGLYNAVIGYLLHEEQASSLTSVGLFTVAMALHFAVNDHALRKHHEDAYRKIGRWILAGTVIAGWAVAWATNLPQILVLAFFSFIGGAIVLNVLKEELPDERRGTYLAFVAGLALYTAILLST